LASFSIRTSLTHYRETATLRDLDLDRRRISLTAGRDSDIRPPALVGDDTENTFVFTVPQRELQDEQLPDGLHKPPSSDDNEDYDLDKVDGMEVEEPEEPGDADEPDEADEPEPTSSRPEDAVVQMSLQDITHQSIDASVIEVQKTVRKKKVRVSKHGVQYPSLPAGVVKKLATTYARTSGNGKAKISKDTLDAIMQASDWFFEQASDDLGAYAKHAGRKTIDESDIVTLMKRFVLALL
jgi:histone H3/H4